MNEEKLNELGITKEDIIDAVAEKALNRFEELNGDVHGRISDQIHRAVSAAIPKGLDTAVMKAVDGEVQKVLDDKFQPVDCFGQTTGEAVTIREMIAKHSSEFWDAKVNEQGRPTPYGGKSRSERLLLVHLDKAFKDAVAANLKEVVEEFKKAMRADAFKSVQKQIDRILK